MKIPGRLQHLWERLRSSYWFIPSLMTIGAIILAVVMLELDRTYTAPWVRSVGWLYQGTAQGARSVLSTVAGSMATVAGVVFSIMIVVLSLASSQFGPRLVRNFLRDAGSGIVFGTFIGTFTYTLLVLRSIRAGGEGGAAFVPQLSVSVGVLTAVVSLGVLIYFIHHVASMIQVENVIGSASANIRAAMRERFPADIGRERGDQPFPPEGRDSALVMSEAAGYIEDVDGDALLAFATERDLVLELLARPGDWIVPSTPLLRAWSREPEAPPDLETVRSLFFLGPARTPTHDLVAAVDQLVEIAVRALSPSINDPFTAVTCMDHLTAALLALASRDQPSRYRLDEAGRLRLVAEPHTFADVAAAGLAPIRNYAGSSPEVLVHLLDALTAIAGRVDNAEVRAALLAHAEAVERQSRRGGLAPIDSERVSAAYRRVLAQFQLDEPTAGPWDE